MQAAVIGNNIANMILGAISPVNKPEQIIVAREGMGMPDDGIVICQPGVLSQTMLIGDIP